MKKIATLAIITLMVIGCNKKSNTAPSSAGSNQTSSSAVWCIKSYTTMLECHTVSESSANQKAQWYRDNGYTMMTVTKKTSCQECY